MPQRQPKRGRLWLNDGSCVRLRPEYTDHVWAYDFVTDRTHDGKALRMLTVVDEYSRECLAIVPGRMLRSDDVIETLADLFVERGVPDHIRSDNGPEPPRDCRRPNSLRGWDHGKTKQVLSRGAGTSGTDGVRAHA